MVPLVVAAPLLLAALVPAVIWGNSFLWGSFWGLLALTVAAAIVLAMTMMYVTVSLTVRWVELRPLGTPAQVVIARFLRSSTMAMADLQRAVVIERLSPGQRRSIKVVLHTPSETVECEPATSAPLSRADAQALTDWLTEQLGQVQVAVERQTEVKQDFLCPDEWWTRSHTAELWRGTRRRGRRHSGPTRRRNVSVHAPGKRDVQPWHFGHRLRPGPGLRRRRRTPRGTSRRPGRRQHGDPRPSRGRRNELPLTRSGRASFGARM